MKARHVKQIRKQLTNHPNPELATKDLMEHSKEKVRELVIQHVHELKTEAEDIIYD